MKAIFNLALAQLLLMLKISARSFQAEVNMILYLLVKELLNKCIWIVTVFNINYI